MSKKELNLQELSANNLAGIFAPDDIRNGESMAAIKKIGGIKGLYSKLKVDPQSGINTNANQIEQRRQKYGDNKPIVKDATTLFEFIKEAFEDEMLRILCFAAIVSLVLGILTEGIDEGWLQGTSILVAVVIIVTVTSTNNYIKEQQFRKLNAISERKNVNVLRNKIIVNISVYDLLVGDIVKVQTGQIMSVDGLLIQGSGIVSDQSSITGQSDPIKKKPAFTYDQVVNPFLISGSKITQGTGEMIVLAVGTNSQYGQLKLKIQQQADQTPLQQKLKILAQKIGLLGMYSSAGTFAALMLHLIYDIVIAQDPWSYWSASTLHIVVEYFIVAVSIIVVAVPEGLPLAVTIALAYSVGKMKEQNNLVRFLDACQTMGGANNICTDKTGTLTKNLMEVVSLFSDNQIQQNVYNSNLNKEFKERFSMNACLNSNAFPIIKANDQFQQIGNKTECSLIQLAFKYGYDFRKIRNDKSIKILKVFPFSSQSKKMGVIYERNGKITLLVKGAPDYVLDDCKTYLLGSKQAKIDNNFKNKLHEAISKFSSRCLRNLLIAQKQLQSYNFQEDQLLTKYSTQLTFITLVGIQDPLRPEIVRAVQQCKQAGITVRMLTGDNKATAVAIAKQAGILRKQWKQTDKKNYEVMEGKDFRQFVGGITKQKEVDKIVNLENFKIIRQQLRVLARSTPQDKYIMATGLKQLDDVVAMTGDGTNDAPTLKKADIGFAMGIAGTQVAKQAAGIILLDDNFKSIVTAIKYGRNILECIRKFLQFQLTVNVVALVLAFLGSVVLKQSPLNPIQMLWVNLIMDTLASLALATEAPTDQLLKRNPYSRFESLITPVMWKNIIFHAIFQVGILSFVLFCWPTYFNIPTSVGLHHHDLNEHNLKHYAIFFNVFVLLQLFNEINARKLKNSEFNVFSGFLNNPLFLLILVSTFVIQYLLLLFGGRQVRVAPLTMEQHLYCYGLGALSIPYGILVKLLGPKELDIFRDMSKGVVEQQKKD